ncbi:transaldolase family protein [Candidatus Dependentiae bacterium]
MKLFLDTADYKAIERWVSVGVVEGLTTNPTLLSKQEDDHITLSKKLCDLVSGDVNLEVIENDPKSLMEEARRIGKIAKNAIVKIPFSVENLPAIRDLVNEGIKVNVTLVFSLVQALLAFKAGVEYISPFVGRFEDSGGDAVDFLTSFVELRDYWSFKTKILAASIRSVGQMEMAILSGADVVTVPPEVLEKATKHVLTEKGIRTFENDWKKLKGGTF